MGLTQLPDNVFIKPHVDGVQDWNKNVRLIVKINQELPQAINYVFIIRMAGV